MFLKVIKLIKIFYIYIFIPSQGVHLNPLKTEVQVLPTLMRSFDSKLKSPSNYFISLFIQLSLLSFKFALGRLVL